MRVQLALEVLQFGLRAAVFELLPGRFGLIPASRHPDGHAYGYDKQVEDGVSGEEAYGMLPREFRPVHTDQVGRGQDVTEEQVQQGDHGGDQQEVAAQEPARMAREEMPFDEPEIVRVEDHHEREGHQQEAHVLRALHQRAVGCRDEERDAQDHGPCRDMDQIPRIFRLQDVHLTAKLRNCCDYS